MRDHHQRHAVRGRCSHRSPLAAEAPDFADSVRRSLQLFGLTISLRKIKVMVKGVTVPPDLHRWLRAGSCPPPGVNHTTDNLFLDVELNKRIGKAATMLSPPHHTRLEIPKLSAKAKMAVYNAWVLNALLYGSGTWTTYAQQERKFGTFHLRCLRRILHISWQDRVLGQHGRLLS